MFKLLIMTSRATISETRQSDKVTDEKKKEGKETEVSKEEESRRAVVSFFLISVNWPHREQTLGD